MGGGESKPGFDQVAMGVSNVSNVAQGAKASVEADKAEISDKVSGNKAALGAASFLFQEGVQKKQNNEIKVPEETQVEIKNLQDLFQKIDKEIDKDFEQFKKDILEQQNKSLEKINLNKEEIERVLEISNEIIKLLGNKDSSSIIPVKGDDGKLVSMIASSKLSNDISIIRKKKEYLKKIGILEPEIDTFFNSQKVLENYMKSK